MEKAVILGILFLSVISMVGLASASDHIYIGDYSVDYSHPFNDSNYDYDRIKCDSDAGDCPNTGATDAYLKVCTGTVSLYRQPLDDGSDYDHYYRLNGNTRVPGPQIDCGYGEHELEVLNTEMESMQQGGSFTVRRDNMEGSYVGENLFLELDITNDKWRDMVLTDDAQTFFDRWKNDGNLEVPGDDQGFLLLQDTDWATCDSHDDPGWYELESGAKISGNDAPLVGDGKIMDSDVVTSNGGTWPCNGDGETAEDVLNHGFDSGYEFVPLGATVAGGDGGCDTDRDNMDSCSPVHQTSRYYPQGEIIVGSYPEFYYQTAAGVTNQGPAHADYSTSDKLFFVCRDDAEYLTFGYSTGSETTSAVVDVSTGSGEELMKCDTSSNPNTWESVNECNDGIDNDGDGDIDDDDPGCAVDNTEDGGDDDPCESNPDCGDEEEFCYPDETPGSNGCAPEFSCSDAPLVGKSPATGDYYAYYKKNYTSCTFDSYGDWDYTETYNDPYFGDIHYPQQPNVYTCKYPDDKYNIECPYDWNSTGDSEGLWEQKGEMPAVEYGADQLYFDLLSDIQHEWDPSQNITTHGVETDFVHNYIGWDTKHQALYEAEKRYDADMITSIDESNCNDCHSAAWWNDRNLTNIDGYLEQNASKFENAWEVGNAGENSSYSGVNSHEGSPFKGGFYGNCNTSDDGTWEDTSGQNDFWDQNWRCEGVSSLSCGTILTDDCPDDDTDCTENCGETTNVEIEDITPSVILPQTSLENTRTIGVVILPYIHMSDTPDFVPSDLNTYSQAVAGTDNEGDSIDSMTVECWAGPKDNPPSSCTSSDRCFREAQAPVSSSNPYGVSGDVERGDYTGYACSWVYHTSDGRDLTGGDTIELHKQSQGTEYEPLRQDAEDEYGVIADEEWNNPGSVVDGW